MSGERNESRAHGSKVYLPLASAIAIVPVATAVVEGAAMAVCVGAPLPVPEPSVSNSALLCPMYEGGAAR
jgi:hypothetical protein